MANVALNVINNGDFLDSDGLLVCGKCGEKKQVKFDFRPKFNFEKILTKRCRCEREKFERDQEVFERNQKILRIERLKNNAISDKNYLLYTFANDDRKNLKISNACRKYAENFSDMLAQNNGLIFCGNVGTGKTFYAACIANSVLEQGLTALVTNIPNLLNRLSADQDEKTRTLKIISNVSLLVLDDLGAERDTTYALEKIFEIVDTRYRAAKPLIVTTNLQVQDMKTCSNDGYKRIFDRILHHCFPLVFVGESRRISESEARNQAMKNFLGV